MPTSFLNPAQQQQYNHFPGEISSSDLIAYFTLTNQDQAEIIKQRSAPNRLGFGILLCTIRYLGFEPEDMNTIPEGVIGYVARQLDLPAEAFEQYGHRSQTRTDHRKAIFDYLDYSKLSPEYQDELLAWLVDRALEHDKPMLLFHMACEQLHHRRIIRPGLTSLERLVARARVEAYSKSLQQLKPLLTSERKRLLDGLLIPEDETGKTQLFWLKQHAKANNGQALLGLLDKYQQLKTWRVDEWDLTMLNPNRQKFLARLGRKSSNQALQRMSPERRYPILVAFLRQSLIDITDEILDIFDVCMARAHSQAKKALKQYHQDVAEATQVQLRLFHEIGSLVLDPAVEDDALRLEIYRRVPPEALYTALGETESIIRPEGHAHFDFLDKQYNTLRRFTPALLGAMPFSSSLESDSLLEAIDTLRDLNTNRQRKLPGGVATDFIPEKWHAFALPEGQPERHGYELCALTQLRERLRAGDLYVPISRRYGSPETYLMNKDKWNAHRQEVCQQLGLTEDGCTRLKQREAELKRLLPRLDQLLDRNEGIRIEDGELIVPGLEGDERPQRVLDLDNRLSTMLPQIELTDLLIEVDQWTGFSKHLTHSGGSSSRIPDLQTLLYAAIIAQGSNMGLTEMARSAILPNGESISYDRLAWTNAWYLRQETLEWATDTLVNFQYQQALAHRWGGGILSSSDGQRFPARGNVRNAQALPRYFGYGKGITFYTWTSDQYSQYGTKVISSTVRDATYVLDEILDNETELTIVEHTTDTHGYTDLVFALFDLLGLQFSPRIRDLGSRTLYKLIGDSEAYPNLDVRLTGRINMDRILAHWDEMLHVAGSLKLGYVTASLLISKLQAYPRQNRLTKLLQEYGRLNKTIFILRYLEDEALRRRIETQLNKGERLHQLRKFLFFGREGSIRHKHLEAQTDQAQCLNLITNAVIVWNTVYMQAAVDQLRTEGMDIHDNDLTMLSPTRFEHISRYGTYHFNVDELPEKLRPLRQ